MGSFGNIDPNKEGMTLQVIIWLGNYVDNNYTPVVASEHIHHKSSLNTISDRLLGRTLAPLVIFDCRWLVCSHRRLHQHIGIMTILSPMSSPTSTLNSTATIR